MKSPMRRVGIIDPEGILNGSNRTERKASTPIIMKVKLLNSFMNFSFLLRTGFSGTGVVPLFSLAEVLSIHHPYFF
jgi:hypothetical protein